MIKIFQNYRTYSLICLISIIVGSMGAVVWAKFSSSRNTIPKEFFDVKTDINTEFPDLGITKYSSSEKLITYLSNRKVLLVIISSSCGACRHEMEVLKTSNFLKNNAIEVALVSFEKEEIIKEFLIVNNLDIPVFDDRNSKIKDSFNLNVTPVNFLIVNGQLDRSWNGSPQNVEELYTKLGLTDQ